MKLQLSNIKYFPIFFLLIPYLSIAQTTKGTSEFTVSYGLGSLSELLNTEWGGSGGPIVNNATGNSFVTYRYYISKVGLHYSYRN